MEERDLNCSEEKSYYPIMGDFATKVTKIRNFEMSEKEKPCKFLTYRTLSLALQDGLEPTTP